MRAFMNVLVLLTVFLSAYSAIAATERSESAVEPPAKVSERHYLFDPVELTPVTGFTVVDSSAGFNLGAHAAYPVLATAPLYLEPSLILGFFSSRTMFNLSAGARYDIAAASKKVRPFARVALGPTFQTSGSVVVFNSSVGGGALFPVNRSIELRAEAMMVNVDGNAGIALLGGISL